MGALEGRVAIITGAGRGIGREHALLFADEGAKVVVNDRGCAVNGLGDDATAAQRVVDEIKANGGEAIANTDDVADWDGGHRLVTRGDRGFRRPPHPREQRRDHPGPGSREHDGGGMGHRHARRRERPFRPDPLGRGLLARAVQGGSQGQRRCREHLFDLGAFGQPRAVQLRDGQGGHRGVHRDSRPGALALRRPGQRDRAGCQVPHHRVDPGLSDIVQPPADSGVFDSWDPANISPVAAYLSCDLCPLTGKVFFVQGGRVQYFQPWTLAAEVDKGGRWTVDELAARNAQDRRPSLVAHRGNRRRV